MGKTAIEVEHVYKRYTIGHERSAAAYTNFRELMMHKVKGLFSGKATEAATKEEITVLNDVSFNIEWGQRTGIIGSNGAGKSTLLKILSRITEPTSGTVHTHGRVVSLLEVGTGFHPELTGRENIFLNGVILGMSRAAVKTKFDEIVAFSEIAEFLDTPVKRYSSGMYMRLAFAVAAHLEPEILIVDEVLAVGDAQFQKKCMAKMEEISRAEGIAVLFVSHNLEAVRSFCTSGILLNKGNMVAQGPIDDVVDKYAGLFSMNDSMFIPHAHNQVFFSRLATNKQNYYFEEDMILTCGIVAGMAYSSYIIGISIADRFDHKAGTTLLHSKIPLQAGANQVVLRLPLHTIVPGTYRITIALALDETLNNLDVVYGYPEFSILSNKEHQQLFTRWSQSWGTNLLSNAEIM